MAGQNAANASENLMIGRETGGLNSATALGNDISTLVNAGFNTANAQDFQSQVYSLQLQVQAGQLDSQLAYQKSQELMASMGVIGNASANAWLVSKFSSTPGTSLYGGSSSTSSTPQVNLPATTVSSVST